MHSKNNEQRFGEPSKQREKLRFPIELELSYQCVSRGKLQAEGKGKSLVISSREISLTTEQALPLRQVVCLAVNWPAMLNNSSLMKLSILGQVVRSEPGAAVVKIMRYEFCTRGRSEVPSGPNRNPYGFQRYTVGGRPATGYFAGSPIAPPAAPFRA